MVMGDTLTGVLDHDELLVGHEGLVVVDVVVGANVTKVGSIE